MFIIDIIHKIGQKWYSNSMKVLILITKSNMGGAQRYVYDLATNLPKDIYNVEVMAGGNGPLIEKLKLAGIEVNGDLPIERDINIFDDIKAFFKLISILRKKRPDVLHVNSSKIGGLGALVGRLTKVPKIIFTAHGWAFNEDRSFISKIFIKLSYWFIITLSHVTIAVSEATKYQMRNWPTIFEKITVIHNGIKKEPGFSKVNARYELSQLNKQFSQIIKDTPAKNLTIIGSVGELHPIKGYEYALRGIHNLINNKQNRNPNRKIVYTIFGDGESRESLEKTIKDLGIESSVILFGHVNNAYQYLKAFDIFLMPSISEGLPYVVLEAGLASLPIVSTIVGGIPEIIDDMKSGILIQSRKIKEIHHAIEFLLTHKKVQKEYGLALHEKVLKEFLINKMVEETAKIYSIEIPKTKAQ